MSDDQIMSDSNVTITTTLAIVNGVSYPVNTISAISVKENTPSNGWILWAVGIGIASLIALGNQAVVAGLVGFGIVALIFFLRPKVSYSLMVRSAGADTSILTGKDSAYLGSVKAAIEEAVRRRG
jgi:tellurite resistance protein TehA-like permease